MVTSVEFNQASKTSFNLLNYIESLTPTKEKGRYICPVCEGNNFTVNSKSGAYSCWSGCESKDIREAVSPSKGYQEGKYTSRKTPKPKRKPKPAPLPDIINLVKLTAPATDRPQRKAQLDPNHGDVNVIVYKYSDTQWVTRTEWADLKQPKGYDKTFRQWHRNEEGQAIPNQGDKPWQSYRIDEAMAAIKADESTNAKGLLFVEGEECVEELRSIGIAGITTKGGAWSESALVALAMALKKADANVVLIYLKDNDDTGSAKAEKVLDSCTKVGLACIVIDPVAIYPDLPEKGDVVDILKVMDSAEFIRKLEEEIHRAVEERRNQEAKAAAESQEQQEEKKSKKIPAADKVAEEIAEEYRNRLAFNNITSSWMRYEAELPGVWSVESDNFIESIVSNILKTLEISGYGSHSYITNIVKKLRCELMQRTWDEKSANELLPFSDGVLELATGKLLPHSPGYKFTWALERTHDTNATDWSLIDEFLTHATGGNPALKEILICFANAVLVGRSDLQKFLHTIGIGGSGKGTYMRLLVDLIGISNVHSSTLEDWCGNRFEAANAYRKRLIVFWDEDKGNRQMGKFKSLTGGDWLRAEEKGKKAFQFKFDGMVAVSSNFPVFAGDNSSGMSRRIIAIPFNQGVVPSKRRDLNKDFQPQLAAFTNYLLSIPAERVTEVLLGLESVPEMDEQFWEGRIRTDSIAAWLNDCVIRDAMASTPVGNDSNNIHTLYGSYWNHCKGSGTSPRASKNFSPDLLELCQKILGWTEIEKVSTRVGKVIKGLRIRGGTDGNIPTYDWTLSQAVKGAVKGSDGGRDGSEPLLDKDVTDSDGLSEYSDAMKKTNEESSGDGVSGKTSDTLYKDEGVDLSQSATALQGNLFDPSHNSSHKPSQYPSQKIAENAVQESGTTALQDILESAQMLINAQDGIMAMVVMSMFCNESPELWKEIWKCISPEERDRLKKLKSEAQDKAKTGDKCKVRLIRENKYEWVDATFVSAVSAPQDPQKLHCTFELASGERVDICEKNEWLLVELDDTGVLAEIDETEEIDETDFLLGEIEEGDSQSGD